jgi:hypothetical protein
MGQKEPLGRAISGILIRANAGYTDDYKIELQGAKYIQWGKVEEDIHALVDDQMEQNRAALAAAQQRIASLESIARRSADWFFEIAGEMDCSAGNPDGGSSQTCEHCQMLGFANAIDAALEVK